MATQFLVNISWRHHAILIVIFLFCFGIYLRAIYSDHQASILFNELRIKKFMPLKSLPHLQGPIS